jgi:hypothetical protein
VLVGRMLDHTEWRMATPAQRERMLGHAYDKAVQHVVSGGALPEYIPQHQQLTAQDRAPPPPPIMLTATEAMAEIRRALRIKDPEPEAPPAPPRTPEPCRRCGGLRKDPDPKAYHPAQQSPGECLACYGSGVEASYNRIVHEDGTTEERLL